ncbi:MAG: tRNA lysidine(34) synthetase TilS [Candidatus Amulumruptor caecigallinarius]|nr:tRNA lysidine(34) synthetase TilS [Candidatus Amulumruptor caecigallinarius]
MDDVCKIMEDEVSELLRRAGVSRLLVGVSGGADSIALLAMLRNLNVSVLAVHCNFGLRGDESVRDMQFVQKMTSEMGVELHTIVFDTIQYCKSQKCSIETGCRRLRYAEFRRIMAVEKLDRIAVGHNADDNAETLLLNLFRGAGIKGLSGMRRDTGEIIRPLLTFSRNEILRYLECRKLSHIEDSSNGESVYRRNFIRNELIPLIKTRWPAVVRKLNDTARIMEDEWNVANEYESMLSNCESNVLDYTEILNPVHGLWLLKRFVAGLGGSAVTAVEIYRAVSSSNSVSGKLWQLPEGELRTEREKLVFYPYGETTPRKCESLFEVAAVADKTEAMQLAHEYGNAILLTTLPPERIKFRYAVRGDRISPLGMTGSKLVSKIFKDHKLSHKEKCRVILAVDCESEKVVWVEGLSRSRLFLAADNVEKIWCYHRKHLE